MVTGQAGITVVLFLRTFSYTLRENLAFSCELTLSGKRKLGSILKGVLTVYRGFLLRIFKPGIVYANCTPVYADEGRLCPAG